MRIAGEATAGAGPQPDDDIHMNNHESTYQTPVMALDANARATFVSRTYAHLCGAIFAFTLIEVFLFEFGFALPIARALMGTSWLVVLGGFVLVSWLASRTAHMAESKAAQYAALGGFIVAEAIIFVPLLYIAQHATQGGVIESAAVVTLVGFAALTALVFVTRKDFSWLRTMLWWAGILALGGIAGSVLFNFSMGTWFSVAMIAVAGGAILYDTSNVLHHYPEDRYVAAALELFASVALMFWYVLRLFMSRR